MQNQIPKHPIRRRSWIVGELHAKGITLAELARENGLSGSALSHAARGLPNNNAEAIIAKALGIKQADLFPEHYNDAGRRIVFVRRRKDTRSARAAEVKSTVAA